MESAPLTDPLAEAERLLEAAEQRAIQIRLIGGIAIRLHADNGLHPALARSYEDIDVATTRKSERRLGEFFSDMGYEANERFNATNPGRRMVFYEVGRERHVDVFIDHFEMCHKIDLGARIHVDARTIPLAELLLTKLQVVHLNYKDVTDIAALVLDHDIGAQDDETINADLIATALASDWGLWRTVQNTIAATRERLPSLGLNQEAQSLIDDRLQRLLEDIEAQPKSLRWKGRARVGDRVKWYQEPEEIGHDRAAGN
jgi:hypothetical protein